MDKSYDRSLYILGVIILVLGIVVSAVGVFHTTGGQPFEVVNQFGDTVRIYGDGLYAYDSHFYAPIFRGSDLALLAVAVPALIVALAWDARRKTLRSRLFLLATIGIFAYYGTSISFGVVYNVLHLVYIILFSAGFFALIVGLASLDKAEMMASRKEPPPSRGLQAFLAFTGIALIVAWLPDIITSIGTGRPPATLEIYTTSVTNVLDIGIIGPVSLLTISLIRRRSGMGYILVPMLLTLSVFVGIMVVSQTVFQMAAGIDLPLPVLVTKTASFVVLALFAAYFDVRFFRGFVEGAKADVRQRRW
ncbi:MAG: hypothetical protein ACYC5M_07170 [Anaerolineae bacterium]